jgi:hypothetical protein
MRRSKPQAAGDGRRSIVPGRTRRQAVDDDVQSPLEFRIVDPEQRLHQVKLPIRFRRVGIVKRTLWFGRFCHGWPVQVRGRVGGRSLMANCSIVHRGKIQNLTGACRGLALNSGLIAAFVNTSRGFSKRSCGTSRGAITARHNSVCACGIFTSDRLSTSESAACCRAAVSAVENWTKAPTPSGRQMFWSGVLCNSSRNSAALPAGKPSAARRGALVIAPLRRCSRPSPIA